VKYLFMRFDGDGGAMNRQFDLATVVEAARGLQARGSKGFQLVLCGDGTMRAAVAEQAKGLDNSLLPGWVDAADIAVLMGWAAVGLAPYAAKAAMSLPNKPAEYLSAGLPVLTSLGGELRALLERGDCGWYYPPGSTGDLIALIERLAAEPGLRQRMSGAARRLFEEELDADRIYPRMVEHLERLVDCSRPAGEWASGAVGRRE